MVMKKISLDDKIFELIKALGGPEDLTSFQQWLTEHQRMGNSSQPPMEDALDWIRLRVKYILFDLEATRRENAYLRRLTHID